MELPELYRKVAFLPKRDAKQYLEEFTREGKWKENARVLDIGCGDGSTLVEVVKPLVPSSKTIVACDINDKMIDYARENYGKERIEFVRWDVSEAPPPHMRCTFDHAFSFYALHWVKQQQKVAFLPKRDAKQYLEEFTREGKWKENARVLDIGCGDGSTLVEVVKPLVPSSKTIVACDINDKMIDYARENYGKERIEFVRWDVSEAPPPHMRCTFDHAFSFYALHWVKQQQSAFANIYETLAEGGNCLLTFLGRYTVYEVFRTLSRTQKWADDLKNVEMFTSPYHGSKNTKAEVTNLMLSVGFKDVQVRVEEKSHVYGSEDIFKNLIKSVNPFHALNEKWGDFMKDYFEVAPSPQVDYQLIVVYGTK